MIKKNIFIWLMLGLTGCSTSKEILEFKVIDFKKKEVVGYITAKENEYGLNFRIKINKSSFKQGLHGFHVHTKNDCRNNGDNAGGHFYKNKEKYHGSPWDKQGHSGDLTNIYIDKNGFSDHHAFSSKLTINDVKGKSLIIHENQDNHSNKPKLGGSGKRIGCAIEEQKKV